MVKKNLREVKILIVDDEEPIRQAMVDVFLNSGFSVVSAENGQAGLKKALAEHPNLILLDLIMPKMGGIEMLKKLRKNKWGKDVPVIILTNYSETEKVALSLEGGVHDYLIKYDWDLRDVVKKVKEKLGL